jgi:protocatechuate 3,4-dioxygenase beta subunit
MPDSAANPLPNRHRRRLLGATVAGLGLAGVAPLAGAAWLPTPPQSRGPFYPLELPLERDNDLVSVAGRNGLARGEIVNLGGRILDERGRPIRNARVEIWQCDANGRYHHPWDQDGAPPDDHFQGYGQFLTGADGGYRFRTIKPVPYPGRAPHIHFAISGPDFEPLVTQMYVAGAPENAWDGLFNRISDPQARARLLVSFVPAPTPGSEPVGQFDIVLAADGRFGR